MERFKCILLGVVLLFTAITLAAESAKQPAVLLQEALYAEEMEGNLEKAIGLYERVIKETEKIDRLGAEATYRLGLCYLKKGQKEKAAEYFQRVISNYSAHKIPVKKADEQLKKIKPGTKKSLFEQINGQVIRFISEKYGETAGEAGQKNLYANSHIYYVDPNFTLYNGGMGFYYNWTGQSITGKTKLSGTSYPNQTLYDTTGQKLDTDIVQDEQRSNFYHIFWLPREPLAPGESLYYGWSIDDSKRLSSITGQAATLTMQNQFGSPVIETFFLVLPKGLEISQSNTPTGSQELLNFNVCWWTKTVGQGENHVERVQLKKVSEIVGQWQSVDFVSSPEQFQPGAKQFKGELFLKEIAFNSDGSSSKPWRWKEGWIHEMDSDVKAQYYIKKIGNEKYLFFPWLSGDVTIRDQKPKYYVLRKVVLSDNKMEAENLTAQGWRLWAQRKLAEAEETFKKAVELDPQAENAYQGLGWAQLNQGKKLNAKDSFEKCIKINPQNAAALNGLGWIAHGDGKIDEAISWWEKAVKASNGSATASLNGLTQVYMEKGDYEKAIKYYEIWLKAEPDNEQVKMKLQQARMLAGDGAKAAASETTRKVYIPDADTKNTGVILDLASGKLLDMGRIDQLVKDPNKILSYFTQTDRLKRF